MSNEIIRTATNPFDSQLICSSINTQIKRQNENSYYAQWKYD